MKKLINNIQFNQTVILSFLLFVGVRYYGLDISLLQIITTFFIVIFLDFIFVNKDILFPIKKIKNLDVKKLQFPYSGVNAGFGIAFFLRSTDLILYIVAACIAIFSKHFIKINGRHFLNPSNIGVFLVLILFPQYAWINTLQWGNYNGIITTKYIISFVLVIILGIFIAFRVYKFFKFSYIYDLILPFLLFHFGLFFIVPYYEPWSSFVQFFSVSFFIFTFFMITDPKTVPKKGKNRIIYAFIIVLNFYVLQFFINEGYSILGSLTISTLLLPTIWNLEEKDTTTKKLFDSSFVFLLIIFAILAVLVYTCSVIYGQPDLLFDNTCNQVVCIKRF